MDPAEDQLVRRGAAEASLLPPWTRWRPIVVSPALEGGCPGEHRHGGHGVLG